MTASPARVWSQASRTGVSRPGLDSSELVGGELVSKSAFGPWSVEGWSAGPVMTASPAIGVHLGRARII
jgi:hypothetical protein